MTKELLEQIKKNFLEKEEYLSEYATRSGDAIRLDILPFLKNFS